MQRLQNKLQIYTRKIDISPYIVIANHVRIKIKKALLKFPVMAAAIKNKNPRKSGTPVKRK